MARVYLSFDYKTLINWSKVNGAVEAKNAATSQIPFTLAQFEYEITGTK